MGPRSVSTRRMVKLTPVTSAKANSTLDRPLMSERTGWAAPDGSRRAVATW